VILYLLFVNKYGSDHLLTVVKLFNAKEIFDNELDEFILPKEALVTKISDCGVWAVVDVAIPDI